MKLTFERVLREDIFCDEFNCLTENNIIDFSKKKIAVLYGPNGAGKTSLAMVLNQEQGTKYSIVVDTKQYCESDTKIFHVINDQNGRNIIKGSTEDFILGDNIKKEYELKLALETGFDNLFKIKLAGELKQRFGISTKTSPFDSIISNSDLKSFISDIANNRSKGGGIDRSLFLNTIKKLSLIEIPAFNETLFSYFVNDFKQKDSIIRNFCDINFKLIKCEKHIAKIEESSDAVRILEKYNYLNDCIVCDNPIERDELLHKKKELHRISFESLSDQSKQIIESIIGKLQGDDPFDIKNNLMATLKTGNLENLQAILGHISNYKIIYDNLITNLFINAVIESNLIDINDDYEKLIVEKPEFENEDIIFIEKFLNDCLNRKIALVRDDNRNLKLLLGDREFLNQDRTALLLSNGEQNFLSLAFELLKGKKVAEEIVLLDDPVSSFDSIYKNKIAYAIIKILESKNTIVLTHNTDLVKLLEHQKKNCFDLYYLNNTKDEVNGFIYVNPHEVEILIYIHAFLNLLRGDIAAEIIDERAFLVSVIPFMRGYCQIINRLDLRDQLTKLMHGYITEAVNVTSIYKKLFSDQIIKCDYNISAQDIIAMTIEPLSILKNDKYPLLNKTLSHTLSYLYLRLNVEKKLVDKYGINTKKNEMLSDIILASFKTYSMEDIQNRVFFLSRKTLLNEFNHFEMDMNIFQPAIDITNQNLKKEREEILTRLSRL